MASPAIIPNPPSTSNPLLETNNLIERFLEDVDRRGLVGEQANASTVLLCAVSARLASPLNLTVSGESSSGKTIYFRQLPLSFPRNSRSHFRLDAKALMHAEEDEFQHKAIFIAEYEGVAKADYAIRTMQSEKMIEWDFVDTGKGIKKKKSRVKGPAAFLQGPPAQFSTRKTKLVCYSFFGQDFRSDQCDSAPSGQDRRDRNIAGRRRNDQELA